MSKIVLCGEAVVDFVPARLPDGTEAFVCRPGGSPFNTAKAAALAGAKSHFLGGLSTDLFGDRLLGDRRRAGVGDKLVSRLNHPTMLAFVEFSDGQPRYAVLDALTATSQFDPWTIGLGALEGAILGVGSVSRVYSPSAERVADFAVAASSRSMIALDPNARPGLIADPAGWKARIQRILDVATIVRLSVEDLAFLAPEDSPRDFARSAMECGVSCVVVTHGENGSEAFTSLAEARVGAQRAAVGDTIGAGDTLMGAMLAWLLENGYRTRDGLSSITSRELQEMLGFASAAAAINCSRRGCSPATRTEIEDALRAEAGRAADENARIGD